MKLAKKKSGGPSRPTTPLQVPHKSFSESQGTDASVAVLTVQSVGSTDVAASALAETVSKYTCGPDFFAPELAALAAGSVEAQVGKKDVSPSDEAIRR